MNQPYANPLYLDTNGLVFKKSQALLKVQSINLRNGSAGVVQLVLHDGDPGTPLASGSTFTVDTARNSVKLDALPPTGTLRNHVFTATGSKPIMDQDDLFLFFDDVSTLVPGAWSIAAKQLLAVGIPPTNDAPNIIRLEDEIGWDGLFIAGLVSGANFQMYLSEGSWLKKEFAGQFQGMQARFGS